MRTSQVWYFVAPEIQQAFKPQPDGGWWGSFRMSSMIFASNSEFNAWSLLARPVIPLQSKQAQSRSLGAFDVLSNEILDIIIDNMDDKSGIIALGLCCEGLWQIIHRHILRCYIKGAAPWARTKIAFQGSYCYDLPKPFLEDGLLERIVPDDIPGRSWGRFRRFFYAHGEFDQPAGPQELALAWREAMDEHKAGSKIPPTRLEQMQKEISYSGIFPQDRTWVLRNLTTQETIDSSKMDIKWVRNGKQKIKMKFEDVLMMKICWTTYTSHEDENLNLHRGVWAGHRFDIVTNEVHSQEKTMDEWRDITDVVLKELEGLRVKLQRKDIRGGFIQRLRRLK
jgi:hypothetical protein